MHGDPLHFHAFLRFIDERKYTVTITGEHRIYALKDEPVFIESVPDETCLVEPGEIHFDQTLYRERTHMAEQGICCVIMDNERFAALDVSYTGVMSPAHARKMHGELLVAVQGSGSRLQPGRRAEPGKKFRDRLGKLHMETIGKMPYVKLIRPGAQALASRPSAGLPLRERSRDVNALRIIPCLDVKDGRVVKGIKLW